ncbi:MAG: SET domain-containing protein-lysine N-methyltransferase [Parachlamydia sp.]|nr:MAG: SET domain-containing protein-lysine N-methyltransferase [Parachlamydia sp.]
MPFSSHETPFHQAVIQHDLATLLSLLRQHPEGWQKPNHLGFNSLELAELLGFKEAIQLLNPHKPLRTRVFLKNSTHFVKLTAQEFEKQFKISLYSSLKFSCYAALNETLQNVPLSYPYLLEKNLLAERIFQRQIHVDTHPSLAIQWIDSTLEYGLFTTESIASQTLIGEYTGEVRRVCRNQPDLNAYCVKYPTRFFSWNYFVIDALNGGNALRFINHSDQPNLTPVWVLNRRLLHLVVMNQQPIPKNTQLTLDYGLDYWQKREKISN